MTKVIPLRRSISVRKTRIAKLSPGSKYVAYTQSQPHFKKNMHFGYLSVYDIGAKTHTELTPSGNISQFEWFDDESIIALKMVSDDTFQLFFFKLMGEPVQLTEHKDGVQMFQITSNGILYRANLEEKEKVYAKNEIFGGTIHVEQDISDHTLFYINLNRSLEYLTLHRLRTEKEEKDVTRPVLELSQFYNNDWHIISFYVNEKGIALQLQQWVDLFYLDKSIIQFLHIDLDASLEKFMSLNKDDKPKIKEYVEFQLVESSLPLGMQLQDLSEDKLLLMHQFRDKKLFTQTDITWCYVEDLSLEKEIMVETLQSRNLTKNLDRTIMSAIWARDSVLLQYPEYSRVVVSKCDLEGNITPPFPEFNLTQILRANNTHAVIVASKIDSFLEIFLTELKTMETKQISNFSSQLVNWDLGTSESITWKASDGLEIEGVLRKPSDFDPNNKYPLLIVVHGGPAWLSPNTLLTQNDLLYYPIPQFIQKGFVILLPNYRGSIGRGQRFEEIYGENMGYGEMDDIHSGIDYLNSLGFIDIARIGCMGWSQGGYISAFLSTHSDRFKAISMGAGVSNWYNYYIANDIRQWALDYLDGDPYDRAEYYLQTAPINKIRNAKTPLLIQHGENDVRVPISSGYEMYRALKSMGIPTQMFTFKGMPHSITKPKENLAVLHQNLNWFCHYLLDEPLNLTEYVDST